MRRRHLASLCALLATAGACASAGSGRPVDPPDRILMIDPTGNTMRQSALGENAIETFRAPLAKVRAAVVASYVDLGLTANFADPATGRYGVARFVFPRTFGGDRIGAYFGCGSSITGPVVDNARVTTDIITTLEATSDSTTRAVFAVAGNARRTDGNSTDAMICASTGKLEGALKAAVARNLAK